MTIRDRNKLKTLVHYVVWKNRNPATLGAIKLNKVPWLADLLSYVHSGEPVTGERYRKGQFGPIAMSMVGILDELQNECKIVVRQTETYRNPKMDYFALSKPSLSQFTADDISLIDECIDFVCRKNTAMGISRKSHDIIWQLAELGEEIPYEAALASVLGEVTQDDVAWAQKAVEAARR